MSKVIAIIADQRFDDVNNVIQLLISCSIKPTPGDNFIGERFEVSIIIQGTETPQQLTTAIDNGVKAAVLEKFGVAIPSTDIVSTKFT